MSAGPWPFVAAVVVAAVVVVGTSPWWVARSARFLTDRPRARRPRPSGTRSGRVVLRRTGRPEPLDPAFVLDLCAAAVRGGAPVPVALVVTGRHLGDEGDVLVRAGTALGLGASWEAAWAGAPPQALELAGALRAGWEAGASPGPQLRAAADALRRARRARVRAAAGALGVRLTLPLGLCFLPAFLLLGLVPVVLGLTADLVGAGR